MGKAPLAVPMDHLPDTLGHLNAWQKAMEMLRLSNIPQLTKWYIKILLSMERFPTTSTSAPREEGKVRNNFPRGLISNSSCATLSAGNPFVQVEPERLRSQTKLTDLNLTALYFILSSFLLFSSEWLNAP